jgi:hypothetical protein
MHYPKKDALNRGNEGTLQLNVIQTCRRTRPDDDKPKDGMKEGRPSTKQKFRVNHQAN